MTVLSDSNKIPREETLHLTTRPDVEERVVGHHQLVEVKLVGEPLPLGLVKDPLVVVVPARTGTRVSSDPTRPEDAPTRLGSRRAGNARPEHCLRTPLSHRAALPSGLAGRPRGLLCPFTLRPGRSPGGSQGRWPSTHQRPAPFPCRSPVSILRRVSFLLCVSLPSFSFLPYPGGDRQSLGRPDAVSLESTEEGRVLRWQVKQWKAAAGMACFTANDTREAPAGLRQVLHSGSPRTDPAPRTLTHQEPSAPPPGTQVHSVPRSLEG